MYANVNLNVVGAELYPIYCLSCVELQMRQICRFGNCCKAIVVFVYFPWCTPKFAMEFRVCSNVLVGMCASTVTTIVFVLVIVVVIISTKWSVVFRMRCG